MAASESEQQQHAAAAAPASSESETNDAGLALAARLFAAARSGADDATLRGALEQGVPAALANDKGDSLLMLAAYYGQLATVRLLLAHGADPDALNGKSQSPLAGVVFKGHRDVAGLLLQAGADPDAGEPSARAAVRLFKMGEEWEALFGEEKGGA